MFYIRPQYTFLFYFLFFCLSDGKCTYLADNTRCRKIDFYMQNIMYRLEIDPMFCICKIFVCCFFIAQVTEHTYIIWYIIIWKSLCVCYLSFIFVVYDHHKPCQSHFNYNLSSLSFFFWETFLCSGCFRTFMCLCCVSKCWN